MKDAGLAQSFSAPWLVWADSLALKWGKDQRLARFPKDPSRTPRRLGALCARLLGFGSTKKGCPEHDNQTHYSVTKSLQLFIFIWVDPVYLPVYCLSDAATLYEGTIILALETVVCSDRQRPFVVTSSIAYSLAPAVARTTFFQSTKDRLPMAKYFDCEGTMDIW